MKRCELRVLSGLLVSSSLLLSSAQAGAVAQSNLSFGNLHITPGSGTIVFSDPWTADAFAQADGAASFDETVDGTSLATAFESPGFATATSLTNPFALTGSDQTATSIPNGIAASSFATAQSSLFDSFTITGGTGPVPVSFSATLTGNLMVFTNSAGISARAETIFDLELDGDSLLFRDDVLSIGSNSTQSLSFATTLTSTRTLQFGTSYFVFIQPDSESMAVNSAALPVPEPSTLYSGLGLIGLAGVKFVRSRRKRFLPNRLDDDAAEPE